MVFPQFPWSASGGRSEGHSDPTTLISWYFKIFCVSFTWEVNGHSVRGPSKLYRQIFPSGMGSGGRSGGRGKPGVPLGDSHKTRVHVSPRCLTFAR